MRTVTGKRGIKGLAFALLLAMCWALLWGAALGESGTSEGHNNEADGSKIESIHIHWVTPDTVDDQQADNLYLRTTSDAALAMQYQIDVSFSGQYAYEPGAIRITLPPQIWHKRQAGNEEGETEDALYGTLTLSVPDAGVTSTNWHYEVNEDGTYSIVNTAEISPTDKVMFQLTVRDIIPHNIVDENISDEIQARCEVMTHEGNVIWLDSNTLTAQIDTEETLSYAYKNGEFYEDSASVPETVLANLPDGADPTQYVYARWRTYPQYSGNQNFSLDVEDQGSVQTGAAYDPAADRDAYVGCYRVVYDEDGNEQDLVWVSPAIMLGAENGGSVTDNVWTKDVLTDTWNDYGTQAYNNVCYIWTAYPAEDFEFDTTYRMLNQSTWTLTEQDPDAEYPEALEGTDPRKVSVAQARSSVTYTKAKWEYPPGRFMVFKYTEQTEDHKHSTHGLDQPNYGGGQYHKKDYTYQMALNHLRRGEDVEMQYEVLTVGYGYVFTAGPLANWVGWEDLNGVQHSAKLDKDLDQPYDDNWNSAEWAEDPSHYLNWYYVMDTTDRWDWFQNVDGEADSQLLKMNSDDYEFLGVTIASPEMFDWDRAKNPLYYFSDAGSTFGFIPDESIDKPAVELWVEMNNDAAAESGYAVDKDGWVYVGSYVVESGATRYIDFAELGYTGVTGYRTRIASNQAATKLAVYPHILLKASDRVRDIVENLFAESEAPTTTFRNDDMMYVDLFHHAERTEVGEDKDVHPNQAMFLDEDTYTHLYIWQDNARATLNGAGYGVVPHKSIRFDAAVDNDVTNHQVRLHYSAYVDEVSNLTDVDKWWEAVELGAIKPERSGVWYDLLPEGAVPDLDSIRVRDGDTVLTGKPELHPNWRDTGRILMVVPVKLTPTPGQYSSSLIVSDRPSISFDATYTWTDINNISSHLVNYIAFESGDDEQLGTLNGRIGERDAMLRSNNNYTPNREPAAIVAALTDLDPNSDEARFVYAKVDVNITVDQMAQTDYVKSVSCDLDGIWTQGLEGQQQVNVYEGQYYTYRLEVASAKDTVTSNMVMYDSIENYLIPTGGGAEHDATKQADHDEVESKKDWDGDWDRKTVSVGAEGYEREIEVGGQWRGQLVSVDVSEFVQKGCAPVIYYATQPWLQFGDTTGSVVDESIFFNYEGRYDLTDSTTWTAANADEAGVWAVPEGVDVTAIALDLRKTADGGDFELLSQESCAAYLHMKAPDDKDDENSWAAKGAYAHRNEDGSASSADDIDWEAALDPVNNMHAYNNTRLIAEVTYEDGGAHSYITMIRNDYTRVGIIPQIIEVEKAWEDDDNHDNVRPTDVTVTLQRKLQGKAGDYETVYNETTGQPMSVTLSEENSWKDILYQVDVVDENGTAWQYTFEEDPAEGYTPTVVKVDDTHFTVINSHENEKTKVSGEKQWLMPDGSELPAEAQALIPASVTVELYRTGSSGEAEYVADATVKPDTQGKWKYSFTGLDKYERGGFEYVYSLKEKPVDYFWSSTQDPGDLPDGYTVPFGFDADAVDVIYNFFIPYGDLSVTKKLVNATNASGDQVFTFHISLLTEDASGETLPLEGEYDYVIYDVTGEGDTETLTEASNGKISHDGTFQLKGGQRIVIKKLPVKTRYAIDEQAVDAWKLTGKVRVSGETPTVSELKAMFINTYSAEGSANLKVSKKLTGHNMPAGKFKFDLMDNNPDSGTYGQSIRPGNNSKVEGERDPADNSLEVEDTISFGALTYTELDDGKTFYYTVKERIPEDAQDNGDGTYTYEGYTYPDKSYEAKVEVTDNGDGTMTTQVFYQDPDSGEWKNGSEYQFTLENSYHAEGKHKFMAWKKMEKRDPEEGEFSFELVGVTVDEDSGAITYGDVLQTKPNNADNEVIFDELEFTELDVGKTYYYLVREVEGSDETVIYSDYQHLYKLTVSDNNNGTLGFAEEGRSVSGAAGLPVFTNDLKDGGLKVSKIINNGSPQQEFTFHIKLTGQGLENVTLDYDLEQDPDHIPAAVAPTPSPTPAPTVTPSPRPYAVNHAPASELGGYAYQAVSVQGEWLEVGRSYTEGAAGSYPSARSIPRINGGTLYGNTITLIDEGQGGSTIHWSRYSWDIDILDWVRPVSLASLLSGCTSTMHLNFSKLDTSRVTTVERMCYNFAGNASPPYSDAKVTLDLSMFDTSSLVNMKQVFYGMRYLRTLNIANWNTRNITEENRAGAFYNTPKLISITIGNDTILNNVPNDGYPGDADTLWRNDLTGEVLMGEALFTEGGHAGTWLKFVPYQIHFEPGEGAGTMADELYLDRTVSYTFTNTFYRFGYKIARFRDGSGRAYTVNSAGRFTVPSYRYSEGQQVTMTAEWEPLDTSVKLTNGTGTFKLRGGEVAVFKNLPAEAAYEVWEDTPKGWILISKVDDSGRIVPLETANAVFTNEYAPGKASASMTASKRFNGELSKKAFTFELYEVNADGTETLIDTKQNTVGGVASFDLITYDYNNGDVGTHNYIIREKVPQPGDADYDETIEYDTHAEQVRVVVTDDGKGNLSAGMTYLHGNAVYVNNTKPGNLQITKTTEGATPAAADQAFSVKITLTDKKGEALSKAFPTVLTDGEGAQTEGELVYAGEPVTVTLHGDETLLIKDLPDGTQYTLTETDIPAGWKQTGAEGDTGSIVSTQTGEAVFTNTYEVKGYASLKAEKQVEDEEPEGFVYTFRLYEANENGEKQGEALQTKTNNPLDTAETISQGDSEVTNPDYNKSMVLFDRFTYTQEGTYYYVITEDVSVDDPTIIPDSRTILATVVVTDENGDGTLTANVTYSEGENTDKNGFLNRRKNGSLEIRKTIENATAVSEKTPFTVTLTLKDKNGEKLSGEYTAVRTDVEGAETEESVTVTDGTAEVSLHGGESLLIEDLPHGVTYTAEETLPDGWKQTAAEGSEGTIVGDETAQIALTNTYNASGEMTLSARKQMDPAELEIPEGAFSFILQNSGGTEIRRAVNNADGVGQFAAIAYTLEDVGKTYTYTVLEQNGLNMVVNTGVQYAFDSAKYTVTVTVEDNGDGTLKCEPAITLNGAPAEELVFTNSTRVDIPIRKVWEGDAAVVGDIRPERVLVQLLADGEVIATRAISTGSATAEDGNIWETKFTGMPEYKGGKKVEYTAQEVTPGAYALTLSKDGETLVLINTYLETEGEIVGQKELKNGQVSEGQFRFVLEATYGGEPMPEETESTNAADGSFRFGPIRYTLEDLVDEDGVRQSEMTFEYLVREVIPEDAEQVDETTWQLEDVRYSAEAVPVVVTVAFDEASGTLTAETADEVAVTIVNESLVNDLKVVKRWADNGNEMNRRPGSIAVTLLADGKAVDTATLTAANQWSAVFENLPVYSETGEEIAYTVREAAVKDYVSEASEITVAEDGTWLITLTNEITVTPTPRRTATPTAKRYKFSFTKRWIGPELDYLAFTLYYADGRVCKHTLNKRQIANGTWEYSAWLESDEDYYVIEVYSDDYAATYDNVGDYENVTDRVYNGGTVTNVNLVVPDTGDPAQPGLWLMLAGGSALALAAVLGLLARRRRKY